MNEYKFPVYPPIEQLPTISALDRLDAELIAVDDDMGLARAMGKYITDECSIPENEAMHLAAAFVMNGPYVERTADYAPMSREDACRTSIFTDVMPLYRSYHTVAEYETWLPKALDVVLPEDGNHGRHANCHQIIDEVVCHTDSPCTFKSVVSETKKLCLQPNFESYDYIVRNEDMRKGLMVLLNELGERKILTKQEKNELTSAYVGKYYQVFSVSR
jgi:hypothetical protein